MYKTAIYCKCEHCNEYFEVTKRRKYCTRKCRDAHYYDTKGRVNIAKRYKEAQKEVDEWRKESDKHLKRYGELLNELS